MKIQSLLTTAQNKNSKAYFTELARILESIRLGTLFRGRCLKKELSEDEKKDIEAEIIEILMPIVKVIARKKAFAAQMDYHKTEEYVDLVVIETYEQFHKFNRTVRVEKTGKTFEIGTYIGILSQNVMKEFIADERELPVNAVRNLDVINDTVIAIAMEQEQSIDSVTADQVAEKLSDKSISLSMISDLLGILHGNISLDDIPDTDIRLQDNTKDIEANIKEDLEPKVKAALDAMFVKFSDLELFILMKEMGFFGEDFRKLTAKELSYRDFFVGLAEKDKDGPKNIEFGSVHVKRPGRKYGQDEEIFVESVRYVKEKFYSNKVAKIMKRIAKLSEVMEVKDVKGNLELYCRDLWNARNNGLND